jgi:cytochrome c-type biogenesis protein CcmH
MFWIISAILTLIALAFILPTLLRKRNHILDGSREQNIFIANEQLKELETRFEKGEIESDDYQSTRDELEQSLFSDLRDSDISQTANNAKSSFLSTAFIALLIPAITIPVYLKVGNLPFTEMLNSKQAAQKATDKLVPRNADGTPDIETMIAGLQKKMEANPENFKGWAMLGRSYMVLKQYPEAVKAYERALKLKPDSVNVILAVADSLAMTNNGEIVGRPVALINQALELEPNNLTALWLGGMAARQQDEHVLAIKRWKKVLTLVKTSEERQEVSSLIAEAMLQLTPEQKSQIGTIEKAPTTSGITVTISLSEKFKAQANPTDLVFVYAKAMSGPPMPLAAVRKQVKDLPFEVELNDAMAMMPNLKLSGFTEVIVGARISKSGQPISQNGDLFSEKSSVKAGDKVNLEIDSVVVK